MRKESAGHTLSAKALAQEAWFCPAEQTNHAAARQAAKRDALLALEAVDARAAKVVELKFFGGLEVEEIAQVLGIGSATVKRHWALARVWLHQALQA